MDYIKLMRKKEQNPFYKETLTGPTDGEGYSNPLIEYEGECCGEKFTLAINDKAANSGKVDVQMRVTLWKHNGGDEHFVSEHCDFLGRETDYRSAPLPEQLYELISENTGYAF